MKTIQQCFEAGMTKAEAARALGISWQMAHYYAAGAGLTMPKKPRSSRSLSAWSTDKANATAKRMSPAELEEFRFLVRDKGIPWREALDMMGLGQIAMPKLPAVGPSGAYDSADLARYLREAAARGMLPRTIARLLDVPTHRVIFMMERLT